MRPLLVPVHLCLLVIAIPSAHAAPIAIPASQAAAPPRRDVGTGVCATAVHLNSFNTLINPTVAAFYVTQPVGQSNVDGKTSGTYRVVSFKNGAATATPDYAGAQPLPFSSVAGAAPPGNDQNIAMRVRGYLNLESPGTYTFGVHVDDGYTLKIGGVQVLQSSFTDASLRDSRQVQFAAAGLYPIELVYFQKTGAAVLELSRSELADAEVTATPNPLPGTFHLVDGAQLFSALAGQSSCGECDNDAGCAAVAGHYCRDGLCQPCSLAARCGPSCVVCPQNQPICDGSRCLPCTLDEQCGDGKICDSAFGECVPRPSFEYGGGCSTGGPATASTEAGLVVALGALALFFCAARRERRRLLALLLLLGVSVSAAPARAQTATAPAVTFDAQTFHPAMGPGSLFTVEGTLMPRRLWPMGGLVLEYANRPLRLILTDTGETYAATVTGMLTAHFMPGVGVTRWLAVGLDLPVVIYQGFDSRTPDSDVPYTPTAGGVGDLRLMSKIRILDNEDGGFGLAAIPELSFPTGSVRSFRGEDSVLIEPRLAADYRFKRGVFIAVNLGFAIRTYNRNVDFGLVRVSDELRWAVGIGVPIARGLSAAAELTGAASLSRLEGGPFYTPVEGYVGGRYRHASSSIEAYTGVGAGFVNAVGSPNLRVLFGVTYQPHGQRPPKTAETTVAPPPDPDGDGVRGDDDRCPDEAGPIDSQGCPDSDHDGIIDRIDKCPKQAGPASSGGCPTESSDTDKDGVLDRLDKCPAEVGPVENEGCPDTDGDKDGVVDRLDKCPTTVGPKDNSGCPLLDIRAVHIRLSQPIRFKPGSAGLDASSRPVIAALSQSISEDPAIKKVRLQVSASGDAAEVKKLAAKRAKVLAAALVEAGVPKKKLHIKVDKEPGSDEIVQIDLKRDKIKVKKVRGHGGAKEASEAADASADGDKPGRHHRRHHRKKKE